MSFFAILLALVFEQARPLGRENPAHASLRAWSGWARHALDAGQVPHGWLAWLLAVVLPALAAALVFWGLDRVHGLLGFVWVVVVLYLTLGFRQFSHHFTAIRVAMESGDDAGARQALARWKQVDVPESSRPVLLKQIIEHAVLLAHRHVFGVMVMFVVGALLGLGPAGAVLYRMAEHVARRWTAQTPVLAGDASAQAAATAWRYVDTLPVRVTALAFAVVGNFEEAIANWRQDVRDRSNDHLLLAATAGAMNLRLYDPLSTASAGSADVSGEGREPQLAHLASLVGLVWRSVLLWMLLLGLSMLSRWF